MITSLNIITGSHQSYRSTHGPASHDLGATRPRQYRRRHSGLTRDWNRSSRAETLKPVMGRISDRHLDGHPSLPVFRPDARGGGTHRRHQSPIIGRVTGEPAHRPCRTGGVWAETAAAEWVGSVALV